MLCLLGTKWSLATRECEVVEYSVHTSVGRSKLLWEGDKELKIKAQAWCLQLICSILHVNL